VCSVPWNSLGGRKSTKGDRPGFGRSARATGSPASCFGWGTGPAEEPSLQWTDGPPPSGGDPRTGLRSRPTPGASVLGSPFGRDGLAGSRKDTPGSAGDCRGPDRSDDSLLQKNPERARLRSSFLGVLCVARCARSRPSRLRLADRRQTTALVAALAIRSGGGLTTPMVRFTRGLENDDPWFVGVGAGGLVRAKSTEISTKTTFAKNVPRSRKPTSVSACSTAPELPLFLLPQRGNPKRGSFGATRGGR
jgi:hypothetical protein